MYWSIHLCLRDNPYEAGAAAAASIVACSPTVVEAITSADGTSTLRGSTAALWSAASLLIAESEFPIRSTIALNSVSDSRRRF
jgi:hypothetical protein